MTKIFKNRITQESPSTIRKLKSLFINMNKDKKHNEDTPYGLFSFTLTPNNNVDEIQLEKDFKSILSHFYKWRYGTKWKSIKNIQYKFNGIIEKQSCGINHIHLTIYQFNVEELSIFISYITQMFKELYSKSSYKISKIYNIKGWEDYISPFKSHKDNYISKMRITPPIIINDLLFSSSKNDK